MKDFAFWFVVIYASFLGILYSPLGGMSLGGALAIGFIFTIFTLGRLENFERRERIEEASKGKK